MNTVADKVVAEFVEAAREAGRRGLMRCSSGNMSWRIDEERMLVTRSRSWMSRLTADDVTVCRIADGTVLEGQRPSVETVFHAGTLRQRRDIAVVLHFQTLNATILAGRGDAEIDYFTILEIPFYIGPVAHLPYLPPGSGELAKAVIAAMADHDIANLANHGQVTVGADFDHVIQNAEFFELACAIIVQGGGSAAPLPKPASEALVALRQTAKNV